MENYAKISIEKYIKAFYLQTLNFSFIKLFFAEMIIKMSLIFTETASEPKNHIALCVASLKILILLKLHSNIMCDYILHICQFKNILFSEILWKFIARKNCSTKLILKLLQCFFKMKNCINFIPRITFE